MAPREPTHRGGLPRCPRGAEGEPRGPPTERVAAQPVTQQGPRPSPPREAHGAQSDGFGMSIFLAMDWSSVQSTGEMGGVTKLKPLLGKSDEDEKNESKL